VSRLPLPRALHQVYARSPRVVGRQIGDEYVLVPLVARGADLDSILNLNRVAAFIWGRFDGRRSGRVIVAAIGKQFQVERPQAAADYAEFVETLLAVAAIEPVASRRAAMGGGPWEAPAVVDRPSGGRLGSSPPCPPRPHAKNDRS